MWGWFCCTKLRTHPAKWSEAKSDQDPTLRSDSSDCGAVPESRSEANPPTQPPRTALCSPAAHRITHGPALPRPPTRPRPAPCSILVHQLTKEVARYMYSWTKHLSLPRAAEMNAFLGYLSRK